MNYNKVHDQIIARSFLNKRIKKQGIYYESHHIIPKCMGGSDDKSNLVLLTAREHFLIHWLLHRIYPNHNGIALAFHYMVNLKSIGRDYKISSRVYEESKIANITAISKIHTGKIMSQESIDKMKSHLKKDWNKRQQVGNKISNTKKEKFKSGETVVWNKNKKRELNTQCPHCDKIGIKSNMLRWHFDNCLKNPNITEQLIKRRNKKVDRIHYKAILSIDFDATIADTSYPTINGLRTNAKEVINHFFDDDFYVIINTCREGKELKMAVDFLKDEKVNFHLVNDNHVKLQEFYDSNCRKISADIHIDDKNLESILDPTTLEWLKIKDNVYKVISNPNFKSSFYHITQKS